MEDAIATLSTLVLGVNTTLSVLRHAISKAFVYQNSGMQRLHGPTALVLSVLVMGSSTVRDAKLRYEMRPFRKCNSQLGALLLS